jgi:hypothetical protein
MGVIRTNERAFAPDAGWEVDADFSEAFSRNTCNGCHGGGTEALPFQHLSLGRTRSDPLRISRFLEDPDGGSDELGRRAELLAGLIDVDCDPSSASYGGP